MLPSLYAPSDPCSQGPWFPGHYTPEILYSQCPMLPTNCVPRVLNSQCSTFPMSSIPRVLYVTMFPGTYVPTLFFFFNYAGNSFMSTLQHFLRTHNFQCFIFQIPVTLYILFSHLYAATCRTSSGSSGVFLGNVYSLYAMNFIQLDWLAI